MENQKVKGRGSQFNLPNRFEKIYIDPDSNETDEYSDTGGVFEKKVPTVFFNDDSQDNTCEEQQSGSGTWLQHKSIPRLRARLYLLLCKTYS